MTEVSRVVDAPPQAVFAVLADGWSYGGWVVGSSHVRAVDAVPPSAAGSTTSVGSWPVQLQDETTVIAVETGRSLSLEAKAWPSGTAAVGLTLVPHDGSARTLVRMTEHVLRAGQSAAGDPAGTVPPARTESPARPAGMAVGRRPRAR